MIKLNLPVIKAFGDYHEIQEAKYVLNDFSDKLVKSKEIGFNGAYWAVFYEGNLPDKQELHEMIKARGQKPESILNK